MKITVVETNSFISRAKSRMSRDEVSDLIDRIATDPYCGALLQGTGGVRKVRYAKERTGKSGSLRIVYYFHNDSLPVFLLTVFAKNEKDSLTKAERNALAKLTSVLRETYGKD